MSVSLLLASASTGAVAGDRELGEYLSAECVTCHQLSGRETGAVPRITGWPDEHFVAVMNAYKDKHRDNLIMQTIAGRLAADEIEALAAYFGALQSRSVVK
ncbi:c-type cytochrome [Bradyrhizobium sp.]|nr:c-type cytochrome [Bradyrhizobium sp.]